MTHFSHFSVCSLAFTLSLIPFKPCDPVLQLQGRDISIEFSDLRLKFLPYTTPKSSLVCNVIKGTSRTLKKKQHLFFPYWVVNKKPQGLLSEGTDP